MAPAEIEIISTSTVRAASHDHHHQPHDNNNQRVELTPWDLQLLLVGPIQEGLLFPKPKTTSLSLSLNLIHNLKTSLSCTLHFFPPLAGRLSRTDNHDDATTSFFIDCNNTGAQFVHAVADSISVADVIDPIYIPPFVQSFFPLNGVLNHEGVTEPLLAVQVTELADGVFIGCTINHMVADWSSFWHFFDSWFEISRGFDTISKPPSLRRWFLDGTDFPIRISRDLLRLYEGIKFAPPPPLRQRIFHFRKESVAKLKEKVNVEMGTDRISSLQAVLAHLLRAVARSRQLEPDQDVYLALLIAARSRLKQPPLPAQYFGNTVQAELLSMKAGELLENGVGQAAWEMNKMTALCIEEKIKSFLKSWVENPIFHRSEIPNTTGFGVGSSPRFNAYGIDFGWGKPITVRSGCVDKPAGRVTLFSGPEDGSIDIEISLEPEILQKVKEDVEFLSAVAV